MWENTRTGSDGYEVAFLQFFARQWVSTILGDIFLNETAFINVSRV